MTGLVIRPLVAGEENLFDSMPDPLPQLRQVGYADGIAGGGFRPETTWVALRAGRVVARAAWLLPPGAVGRPWLERFDLTAEPEVGAAVLRAAHEAFGGPLAYYAAMPAHWRRRPDLRAVVEAPMAAARLAGLTESGERLRCSWAGEPLPTPSGRYTFRPPADRAEIRSLIARIAGLGAEIAQIAQPGAQIAPVAGPGAEIGPIARPGVEIAPVGRPDMVTGVEIAPVGGPDVVTGAEIARVVGGVDLATDPLAWMTGPVEAWRVASLDGVPVGLAGTFGDACYPLLSWCGLLDPAARPGLLAEAVRVLAEDGAYEVIADVDSFRVDVLADLERTGFRQLRSRVLFEPAIQT